MAPSRILIIDDEETLAENLKIFLGRHAFDVRIAPDGDASMEILQTFAPDVVVFDYALPGIDGLQTYKNIVRASLKPLRGILITGDPSASVADRAHQQGVRQLLCKPFSFAKLHHAVNACISELVDAFAITDRRTIERRSYRVIWTQTNCRRAWSRRVSRDAVSPEPFTRPLQAPSTTAHG